MKAGELFSKTMPFVWAKLLLGLVTALISAALLGIFMGIAWLIKSEGVTGFMVIAWLIAVSVVRFVIMHYFGYLVKAGHIAVMAEAVTTGRVPDNQVAYGKQKVIERFAVSNVYFAVDKLVSGAVRQINRIVGKVGGMFRAVPGMSTITSLAQFFVNLSLGYVDECCLGYTFYKKDQDAFRSAADGVVIYAQNWKTLLANAAKTMVMVVLGLFGITLALTVVLGLLFSVFSWPGWVAFLIALLLALAVKSAIMDSFVLARSLVSYMEVAPSTEITYDLYSKLSGMSSNFKQLFNKGQAGKPAPVLQPVLAERQIFCGNCGAKQKPGVKFCANCGTALK